MAERFVLNETSYFGRGCRNELANEIKKACNIKSGSGNPKKNKVAKLSKEDVRKIAEYKMPDLNANDIEAAMKIVAGSARSMGVEVEE